MKNSIITFSAASVLLISLIAISVFKIGLAAALTDATSTLTGTTTAPGLPSVESASTTPIVSTGTTTAATSPSASSASPSVQPSLKLVHVVGQKYIDYFTDGTKTYSYPGDPAIDGNLNKPNAPIPSHAGLTWVSTSGMEAYDTPSGDLEPGDYAQESDGSYITNVPAYTFTDATSSVPIPAHIATSKTDPTAATQ